MVQKKSPRTVPIEKLRWKLDSASLPFKTTKEVKLLRDIIGQERGVEAFRFGMGMSQKGYNIFVTGAPASGRMSTVRRLIQEMSRKNKTTPDDICYLYNFKNPGAPILIKFKPGNGNAFKKDMRTFVDALRKEVPRIFDSQEYISQKKIIMAEYEEKGKGYFKELEKKVREEGFALVDIQMGDVKRPDVMPLIDGSPVHIDQVEDLVENDRFPKKTYVKMKNKQAELKEEIDQIFIELRDLQKEVQHTVEEMDRMLFMEIANDLISPLVKKYKSDRIISFFENMLEDMVENLHIFMRPSREEIQGLALNMPQSPGDHFLPYSVNLLVNNEDQKGPPIIIESYPTYKNLFGGIERVVDRSGVWRTDFSKIKAGSLVKANGGYLVVNLLDAVMEPGVWPALKRVLKTMKMEIDTYDPFYLFTTTGLKPEPVDMDVKVVIIGNLYLYDLLMNYDEDTPKIFKVRADFDSSMNRNRKTINQFIRFIKKRVEEDGLSPFDRSGVAAMVEEAVRMSGMQEKISTSFPDITDLIREAHYWAKQGKSSVVKEAHVDKAVHARRYRSSLIEDHIQDMINRGTVMINVKGSAVGQLNGLAVYSIGDYMFGKPCRITASTSMGRAGIINIEREADMSGSTHNKGILILSGYLRKKFAQTRPLAMSASIAFEQSYSGVDGDSASSTEIYALLSSLSGVPIKQNIGVTGSVNQNGEIQAIGGVNEKIEGFFDCCSSIGLTGDQGVMIPASNIKDLQLRKDVVQAIKAGKFNVYSVKTIDEGIEVLTGIKAGRMKKDCTYPENTINGMVDDKLAELAEGLEGDEEQSSKPESKPVCKGCAD